MTLSSKPGLCLIAPSLAYEGQILDYREEIWAADGRHLYGVGGLDELTVPQWLDLLKRKSRPETCPEGLVPDSVFLCVRGCDDTLVGIINIRHSLNSYLSLYGGHIGYAIRPAQRRKGYAEEQLRLGLVECQKLGIAPVLLTCLEDNTASRRTIIKNGGEFERVVTREDGSRFERYWISLKGQEGTR